MQFRGMVFLTGVCWLAGLPAWAQQQSTPPAQPAQTAQPAQGAEPAAIFHTETRLVPVDVVVKDKKDNYVRDLTKKDFKVSEDGKEQEITTFSFGADPNAPASAQQRYLVLFFDNSTMNYRRPDSRAAGSGQIHRRQRQPRAAHGHRQFRRFPGDQPEFYGQCRAIEGRGDGRQNVGGVSEHGWRGGGGGGGGGMGGRTMGSMGSYGARTCFWRCAAWPRI